MRDFNLVHSPADKNNDNFNSLEATDFNNTIDALGLLKIPLTNRSFTWSNNRSQPTFVKLDRDSLI